MLNKIDLMTKGNTKIDSSVLVFNLSPVKSVQSLQAEISELKGRINRNDKDSNKEVI